MSHQTCKMILSWLPLNTGVDLIHDIPAQRKRTSLKSVRGQHMQPNWQSITQRQAHSCYWSSCQKSCWFMEKRHSHVKGSCCHSPNCTKLQSWICMSHNWAFLNSGLLLFSARLQLSFTDTQNYCTRLSFFSTMACIDSISHRLSFQLQLCLIDIQ